MPRALWSGSLSFGLVNVPVQMVSAARDLDYHFHQRHQKDKVRIEQRRFCSKEDVEVLWEEIAHSYDLNRKQVVITDEELASVQPRKTRTIDIEAFVQLADVDPIYFDHPYYLVPAGDSEGTLRAYRLLVEAMGRSDRVALGRVVMRAKEYLVAVRVRDDALALSTMLFHDEVRPSADIPTAATGGKKPSKRALDQAVAIIEELSTDWNPDSYTDCYRKRLKQVIDSKRKGKRIHAPEPKREPSPAPDLMEALERTLESVKG
jgi:DNA end-binding protein Ku